VRQPEEIVSRHFGESLFAAEHLLASADRSLRVIDVGPGAGFPGLPQKIYAPQIRLTLIESNSRKAAFLREVIRTLTFTEAEVFAGRAEEFTGSGELVTMRAVEKFDRALPAAGRLVQPGGRIALLIGASQVEPAQQGLPDFDWDKPKLIPRSEERVLLVGRNLKS
jgi:16S rRNA (guanine527-N7)-methyltransferase